MLAPNELRHYETASIQRAGYCIQCGTKLTPLEAHACDQCAIYLYADPNSEMREDEDDG